MTEQTTPTKSTASLGAERPGGSTPETRKKRKQAMIILATVFLFIGVIWFIYWIFWGRFEAYTDDAYVNGNIVQLMSQVPGTVIEINADVPSLILKGQTIIKLDPTDAEIAFLRAKAIFALTVRKVRQSFEQAKAANASVLLRRADLNRAQLDLKRRVGLVKEQAISREELHHYQTAVSTAKAQYDYAVHRLQALLAVTENAHLYTHPLVEREKANLRRAYLNVIRTTVVAPVTGFIAKRSVQVGQAVDVSTPMLAIVPLDEIWVDANYKESQLSQLRVNQPVTLYADAYDGVTYHGKVLGLTPGTGATFSLLPPQNATGNWIKIVQRLSVRIGLDQNELKKYPLQIGLSMRVTTNIHDIKNNRLAGIEKIKPIYQTTVYANQLKNIDDIIHQLLLENAPNMFIPSSSLLQGKD